MNYYEKFKYSLSSYDNEIILNNFKTLVNKKSPFRTIFYFLAGAEGIEPSTFGFGDRRSTN